MAATEYGHVPLVLKVIGTKTAVNVIQCPLGKEYWSSTCPRGCIVLSTSNGRSLAIRLFSGAYIVCTINADIQEAIRIFEE